MKDYLEYWDAGVHRWELTLYRVPVLSSSRVSPIISSSSSSSSSYKAEAGIALGNFRLISAMIAGD